MLSSWTKHLLHCALLVIVISVFEIWSGGVKLSADVQNTFNFNPWERYGFVWCLMLYLLRCLTFLPLPQVLLNFGGLTLYNAFQDKVVLKGSPLLAPFICIRIVTRGDYPQLVKANVARNMARCLETGKILKYFLFCYLILSLFLKFIFRVRKFHH